MRPPAVAATIFFILSVFAVSWLGIQTRYPDRGIPALDGNQLRVRFSEAAAYQQKIIEEKEQAFLASENRRLEQLISTWVDDEPGDFGVAVQELSGIGRSAAYQADKQFVAASTYKLFFVYAVLHLVETTDLTLESKTDLGLSIEECIDSLITYSWDRCGFTFASLVGFDELDALLLEQGFSSTDLTNYTSRGAFTGNKYTTAADEALFMEKLQRGELLNTEHTELMINYLKDQIWRQRIPAGVPEGIEVADKPGWLYGYENDAAIVYGQSSTYVLVILSNNSSEPRLAALSSLVYDFLNASGSGITR